MRHFHRFLIPLLVIATVWIHYANHKAFQEFPRPFFAAMDSLKLENILLQQNLTARQATIDQLTQQVSTLTAQIQKQPAQGQITPAQMVPTSTHRSFDDNAQPQDARLQLVSMQTNSDPWGADLTTAPAQVQPPARAQTLQYAASSTNPTTSADDYWRQIQEISEKYIIGRDDKTKFLKDGSALIQKLQEAQQNLQIDLDSVQFLEVKAQDEGLDGLIALNNAKKKMAEQMSLIAQYQRDIETLINPYKTASSTPKMPGTLTPNVGQSATRYSHLSMESEIVITQNRTFLVTLHFFYTDSKNDPPQLVNVTDVFNLSTMTSVGEKFFYPEYFLKDVYELVRKTWRDQGVKWNRKPTTEDLQVFLTVINNQ